MAQVIDEKSRRQVIDNIGDRIDQYEIAELIYEAIKDQFGIQPTEQHCWDVWYRVLDELGDLIATRVKWLEPDFDD